MSVGTGIEYITCQVIKKEQEETINPSFEQSGGVVNRVLMCLSYWTNSWYSHFSAKQK